MNLLLHLYYRVHRGPHGNSVALVIVGSLLLFLAYLVAVLIQYRTIPVEAALFAGMLFILNLGLMILNLLRAKVNDTHFAVSLEGSMQRAGYQPQDFFIDGAAATPSLQLLHFKILRLCQPQRVLELGSGQTTKLLSCYAKENSTAFLLTLEQDETWVNILKPQLVHDYRHAPLQPTQFTCNGSQLALDTKWYAEQPELLAGGFDYMLIDGPDNNTPGTSFYPYSRSGILKYLPTLLAPSFVLVFDDAERYGEIMTIQACEAILKAAGTQYRCFSVHGIKTQVVFCSPDRSFLRSV